MNLNKEYKEKSIRNCQQRKYNILQTESRIKTLNENLEREAAHTEENKRYQRMIVYAEELYNTVLEILKEKEEPLFGELNAIIKKNFEEMFHEKDKYAQMGEDYRLHLYYNSIGSFNNGEEVEEKSLSEGEIIARNFVFIVSILELAQKKKKEELENGDSDVLELPLVLDGPFSKLGDDNTGLIAKVLPKAAEQVIIFMLDKDWNASGLEKYTLPEYRYRVNKDINSNSSVIEGGK